MTQKLQAEPIVFSSLGLKALFQRLQGSADCRILDLGPVRRQSIEFWSQFSPYLYVADLRSQLPLPIINHDSSETAEYDWNLVLGLPPTSRHNVILAWDLLNYLDLPSISSLIQYLKHFSQPGTVLFAMVFDQKQMPERIPAYSIVDEDHLAYEYSSPAIQACPRHQPRALATAMQQFKICNSFRLRNNVVEFLFVYEADP
jgi:hypothetical protein